VTYRRRASPLHAARAAVAAAYCLALAVAAFATFNPIVLAVMLAAVLAAAAGAGVRREVLRAGRYGLAIGLLLALINPFVASANGLTVVARLGHVPILPDDITLEAIVYGGILGLRAVVVVLACALGALCVDPDELLALFRRRSLRSALTAALATRLLGVLAADARRLADAQRCRPGPDPSRVAIIRAVASGALDRAIDVAATLEVRGYGAPGARGARGARGAHAPWSRHDLAFAAAALAVVALLVGARLAGVADFAAYPRLHADAGAPEAALCAALLVAALAPFADRRGIDPGSRRPVARTPMTGDPRSRVAP
jgi:energy-coupling factor transport system permease protein